MSKSYCTHFLASLLVLIGAYSSHADEHLVEPLDILADPFVKQEGSLVSFLSDQCCDCGDTVSCGDGVDCGSAVGKKDNPSPCLISHKGLFYANDFSYLNDPCYKGSCLGDYLKLMPVAGGDWGTLDFGGQLRLRYHHERGMGQSGRLSRFQATETEFVLTRLRLYTNWKVNDRLRIFTEAILAEASDDGGNYIPRGIDRNYGDFLNLFADLKVTDGITVRIGRQELLYGNQRLVSPLDWANVRRTFEGVKIITTSGDWAVDGFFTHLVPVVPNVLDEADYDQPFYGCNVAYSGFENFTVETYYYGYDNENPAGAAPGSGDFSIHTVGMRINGGIDDWLFEMEGGPQFGRQSGLGLDHDAGFCTCGLGRKLGPSIPWSPVLWFYYDYASGNNVGGDFNRFNQLFPLAHKYFGFIDAVQRSNIESPNILLTMKPSKKLSLLLWYWHLMSNQDTDIVPAIGGTPPQSTTSKDLGDELDIIARYQIAPRSNILFGWSHFWRGNKILAPNDADFFYSQWELNF